MKKTKRSKIQIKTRQMKIQMVEKSGGRSDLNRCNGYAGYIIRSHRVCFNPSRSACMSASRPHAVQCFALRKVPMQFRGPVLGKVNSDALLTVEQIKCLSI